MTKEDYQEQLVDLENAINKLKEDYIKANQKGKIGQKVKVTFKETIYINSPNYNLPKTEEGIIESFEIDNWEDNVIPIIQKLKKDGTLYQRNTRLWYKPDDRFTIEYL